jgi:3-hydroxyacyl-CoA dehydrogenase
MKKPQIKKAAVLGGGVIGSSWAANFIWKGFPVNVYDISEEALQTAKGRVRANMEFLVNKGVLSADKMNVALGLAKFTTRVEEALEDVQFIQECVLEKYEIKQALVAEADRFAPEEAVFASSTSGLLITEIARHSKYPQRCVGAHPYNPVYLIPLVEITKGEKTADETVRAAFDVYRSIGKDPIVLKKEAPGFIANRLALALYREAVDLVMRGVCTVEDVDKALCSGPGLRYALMGPNLTYHLGGGSVGLKGLFQHVGPSIEMWWADMADWKKWPEGWFDMGQEGVCQEMANRPPEEGRTAEEIAEWRDDKLISLLKILGKL